MLERMRLLVLGLPLLLLGASCLAPVEVLPLTVSVDASRTSVAPQDSIVFVVRAGGSALVAIQAEYGDGASDSFYPSGARTATVSFVHTYLAKGTYTVTATVADVTAGQQKATVQIRVN